MTRTTRRLASGVIGGVLLLGTPSVSGAQESAPPTRPLNRIVSLTPGAIQGVVLDEGGAPVDGATVTAIGSTTAFTVSDGEGRFEIQTLAPGPYVVRAHLSGYIAPQPQVINVRPSGRATSSIALRRANARPVLAAGFGLQPGTDADPEPAPPAAAAEAAAPDHEEESHTETAWRLRHARRGVLKSLTLPEELVLTSEAPVNYGWGPGELLAGAAASARAATSFFTDPPFSGQVNLLATGSFEAPREMFDSDLGQQGIAYVRLGAPVGSRADWSIRGALTQSDLSSWILAGSYTTRAPATHRYDLGMSYSTQRYDGGNPLALRDVTDGSRNVGMVYGFDSFAVTPTLTLTYGGRYARYDYLEHRRLISPRVELTLAPGDGLRVSATVSRRATAPGAEEFLPPGDSGIWLPPQRTFSSLEPDQPLAAQHTTHAAIEVERDIAASTVAFRVFRQQVDDQLVTMFGVDLPSGPSATLGHYFVANAGDAEALGCAVAFETTLAKRLHGSVEYTLTEARLTPGDGLQYLLLMAPTTLRPQGERIHDVSTTIQADVPETATRVLVLYRVGNGFARPAAPGYEHLGRSGIDARFDLQVRQSLPFLNFTSAKWEMLVAVRDFFREGVLDQSVYDELLVVRPPKRIVGGVTLHF